MDRTKGEILQGTLDLMVLKVLEGLGPMHRVWHRPPPRTGLRETCSKLNQGTLYPALLRLQQRGWINSKRGASGE